ncbi:hypothetical protein HYS95_03085 [Candidatus Daviesbacteria bacterium]|nr:hypothetical protein [Candidatus Daviesbacteria bacterium]
MISVYRDQFIKTFITSILLFVIATISILLSPGNSLSYFRYVGIWAIIPAWALYFLSYYLLTKAKGRSSWFTLLGLANIFGLLILLLLPNKAKREDASVPNSNIINLAQLRTQSFWLKVILGLLLAACLFMYPLIIINSLPFASGYLDVNLYPKYAGAQAGIFMLIGFIYSLILIIKNQRLAITLGGYFLPVLIMGYLVVNINSPHLDQKYMLLRNVSYLFLMVYSAEHLLLYGIRRLMNHSTKVFTVLGILNWSTTFMLINFAYAFVTLKP